ncbi:MAG: enoyl-CoA hydratase/isomerase family protein [Gemmatimonadota bacterium]
MSEFERLLYEVADGVATVTLNRPDKRNALDDRTVAELKRAFRDAGEDDDVRAVLLGGAGPDFCAGADLAQMERIAGEASALENLADAAALGDLLILMRRLPRPIVGAVHGHAYAGGAGLATACDLVVASDDAVFGYPEVHLGFVPAMVMALLKRVVGEKVAFELVARGDKVGAEEAARIGLVNRVLPAATFEADAREYAVEIAARPASSIRLSKRLLYGLDGVSFEDGIARGAEVNVLARMTDECREGVRRFLERRRGAER